MHRGKTFTKTIRKQRQIELEQYDEYQNHEMNNDSEEEDHISAGESGVPHAPPTGSGNEAEQPHSEERQTGPDLT